MPLFDPNAGVYSVEQGNQLALVNAEQLGAGKYSIAAAIADKDGSEPRPVVITTSYASQPSSVEYDIYVAWDYSNPNLSPNNWTLYPGGGTTNVAGDQITLLRDAPNGINFRFICVLEKTSPGVNATVTVRQ